MSGLPGTYGAVLLGAFFASSFSGIIASQCIVYFKLFPQDKYLFKGLVLTVWLFDILHTGLIWSAMWQYNVVHLTDSQFIDHIPPTIAFSVVLTASLTFLCHCFFAHRIHRLSRRNWYLTAPVLLLAIGRLALASVSGGEMVRLKSYILFRERFRWLFSLGLGLSSAADVLIIVLLLVLLRGSRSQSASLDRVINSLILYSFEVGSLTSLATISSMICWVLLDDSLMFLGLHFVIGKLYANSLLASLNARVELRRSRSTSVEIININSPRSGPPAQYISTQDSEANDARPGILIDISKSIRCDE